MYAGIYVCMYSFAHQLLFTLKYYLSLKDQIKVVRLLAYRIFAPTCMHRQRRECYYWDLLIKPDA